MKEKAVVVFRSLLTIPAAFCVWFAAFIVGNYLLGVAAAMFCPAGSGSGTDCYAASWVYVEQGFEMFFSGLSAMLVVGVSAVIAPARKLHFALAFYCLGAVVATSMAISGNYWLQWLTAVIAGALTVLLIKTKVSGSVAGVDE